MTSRRRCVDCRRQQPAGLETTVGWFCADCLWTAESEDVVRRSDTPAAFGTLADTVEQMDETALGDRVRDELSNN